LGLMEQLTRKPITGKLILKLLKRQVYRKLRFTKEKVAEEQARSLSLKFEKMAGTTIGDKLNIKEATNLSEIGLTDYSFYEPFFANPDPSAFMHPIENYIRTRTSGTSAKEKWFMFPKSSISRFWRETGIAIIMTIFNDGEGIKFEYGDVCFINVAPRPFLGGYILPLADKTSSGLVTITPDMNLPYQEKIDYFINNYERIDGAVLTASSLISQIIPKLKEKISLKGVLTLDSPIAQVYEDEITEFCGTPPKTLYATTETFGCTVPSVQYPLAFFFDWRRGIFEFHPFEKGRCRPDTLIDIRQVKTNHVYQPVFTSLESEITRYVLPDLLKCIAESDDALNIETPVFMFQQRHENTVSIQNFTRISENELLTAFRKAAINISEFTARTEVHNGLEYMKIIIEENGIKREEFINRLDKSLGNLDKDYLDLTKFFNYVPIKVEFVPKGTFLRYTNDQPSSWGKIDRINMQEEKFSFFLEIAEKVKGTR